MIITLRNIKNIRELCFEIPNLGVWVITGLNGSGKTSLLASIYRVGAQHAFQKFFKTSRLGSGLDSYHDTEIEYRINGETVKYHYGGKRWRATPQKNSNLFKQSPYSSIDYIEASGDRIEPFPDEIQPRRLNNASDELKKFLTNVLADEKWNDLKYVNAKRGAGNKAYLIPYQFKEKKYYFSEKSFSLGELCTLKLGQKICSTSENSLLLIDEVEMALHPQAQVRLFEEVCQIAKEKNLTVLFSTHSATLIKRTGRKNLIHLKADDQGYISTIREAFPAQILGDIAFDDELLADFIFYVEDNQAKLLAEQLIGMYIDDYRKNNANYFPLCKIAPVGGFVQVIEMLNTSSRIFPSHVRRFALLDNDVKSTHLKEAEKKKNQALIKLFERAGDKVYYLPCTPEVGVIEMIDCLICNKNNKLKELDEMFVGHFLNLRNMVSEQEYMKITKDNSRDRAKKQFKYLVEKVSSITGHDEMHIRRTMYDKYVKYKYSTEINDLRALFGPIFNGR